MMSSFTSQSWSPISGRLLNCACGSLESFQNSPIQTVAGPGTLDLAFYQSGGLEYFQVLAHRRLGQGQDLDDLTANAVVDGFQVFDDPDTGRMSQGLADTGKAIGSQRPISIDCHGLLRVSNRLVIFIYR
jgi:hypothetical protein